MEHIKHKIEKLDNQLNTDEYDSNEKYIIKEEKLKKWGKRYNKDELFNMLFNNQMDDVNIDDKIVMLYDIDRYDVEQFNKSVKMLAINDNASDDEDKNNDGVKVESFSSQLFNKIKSIVIKGLELLNQLINDKLDELIKIASEALSQFIKEQGTKLIKYIIDSINGGVKCQSVYVKIDKKNINLGSLLSDNDCNLLESVAKDVKGIYDKIYSKINKKIKKLGVNNEDNKDAKDNKKDKDIKTNEKKGNIFCCFMV